MASNIQRGTRGLSAGDITRLKRLNGARNNLYYVYDRSSPPRVIHDKDITNPAPRLEPETGRRVYTEVGGSKIRRPASGYTDFIAAQTADYVLEYPAESCGVGKSLVAVKVCRCAAYNAVKHNGLCRSCTHDRIVVRPSDTPSEPPSNSIIIPDLFCFGFGGTIIIPNAGTYLITNDSITTIFRFNATSGGSGPVSFVPGTTTSYTFPDSGTLLCPMMRP